MEVDENSRKFLTINTHRGLFQYNRLPFGIKCAPGIFQQCMDTMLAGIDGAVAYLDDIIVSGKTAADHQQNLFKVLQRIEEYGFHLKLSKSKFSLQQIHYLGFIIDAQGRRPDPTKTKAVCDMPAPHNETTLRSFLGGLNYYGAFISHMSTIRAPFDELLRKDVVWQWSNRCQNAFDQAKEILQSNLILTHYDPSQQIIVAADASSYGIGAVILHRFSNGTQKAIAYASRTLSKAEESYSQIEKEGLALILRFKSFIGGYTEDHSFCKPITNRCCLYLVAKKAFLYTPLTAYNVGQSFCSHTTLISNTFRHIVLVMLICYPG